MGMNAKTDRTQIGKDNLHIVYNASYHILRVCKVFGTNHYAAIVSGYQYLSQELFLDKHFHSRIEFSHGSVHLIDAHLHLLPTICWHALSITPLPI